MTRLFSDHFSSKRAAKKIEIADDVKNLVTNKLVRESQGRIDDFLVVQENYVGESST